MPDFREAALFEGECVHDSDFVVLNSMKIYREAYLVGGSYPNKDIYLLQHTFNNWYVNLEFDKMAAARMCWWRWCCLCLFCCSSIIARDK